MRSALVIAITLALATAAGAATIDGSHLVTITKHRMFYNDDGDTSMAEAKGPFQMHTITDAVDVLAGTPVTTLVFCAVISDCTNYPSKVCSMAGWRKVAAQESGYFKKRYDFYQYVRQNDIDIPKIVMERAQEKGLEFIPSMRMNDAHFGQKLKPVDNPETGKFWLDHPDFAIGPADFSGGWGNGFLQDFKHKEVRDYRLAICFEVIDRYGKNGFEMDWTRHYTFFKPGEEQPELLTDMVRQVRKHLDELGKKEGRRLPLIMRVAASIDRSMKYGLDVRTWVKEGLVDYLVPSSPSRYISMDMPIDEWMDLVKGTDVEVHPAPDSASPRGNGQATLEMYRAAASNYYAMGANGFYLFNLFCQGFPLETEQYMIMHDVSSPAALSRRPKMFMVTGDQWHKDTSPVPAKLTGNDGTAHIGIWVGDDLAAAKADNTFKNATLRVRLDTIEPEDQIEISLNGTKLDMSRARVHVPSHRELIAFNASIPTWTSERLTLGANPGIWYEIDLNDVLPRVANNIVAVRRIRPASSSVKSDSQVVNVDLRVSYNYCGSNPGFGD